MTTFDRLATLAQLQAAPRAKRKDQLPMKLDRAIAARAARLLDERLLRQWAYAVKERDHWKDRKTGQRVTRTWNLDPCRAESHHLEPKSNPATRYDVRNGITLSLRTHLLIETYKLRIEGTAWFTVRGCRYVDATFPVIFVRT